MARRVFFSFHHDDIWRANQVRNANVVAGSHLAGFFDRSEYEVAKKAGKDGIHRMILSHLEGHDGHGGVDWRGDGKPAVGEI